MFDGLTEGAAFAQIVRGYVERATAPLIERIAALEARPEAKDGLDGAAGKDAEPITDDQIAEVVRAYFEAKPPAAGKDGRDGADGKDGERGADGVDGKDGQAGEKGDPGADGVGLVGALIDKDGNLVLTNTKGETIPLGKVVGSDGIDGQRGDPGRDGLSLTGFDTALSEDGRFLTLSLENDDLKVTHELQLPAMIYRGVFKDGGAYLPGDMVTWAGSLWHCDAETAEKPDNSAAWTLAAKRGRDGKDAK